MERNSRGKVVAVKVVKTRMVQMNKIKNYLHYKAMMMEHLAFAVENQSIQDSLYHLFCYHKVKDFAQSYYFSMTHEERKDLHTLMIL